MAVQFSKIPDGDVNLGSMNGAIVDIVDSSSNYPGSGGYQIVDGVDVVNTPSKSQNVSLYKVLCVLPSGGSGGYVPQFDPVTKKVAMMRQNGSTGPLVEAPTGTDISLLRPRLLLMGL